MACKRSNFLGECELYNSRSQWTDDDGICFVEDDEENDCPNFKFIHWDDIPSAVKTRKL